MVQLFFPSSLWCVCRSENSRHGVLALWCFAFEKRDFVVLLVRTVSSHLLGGGGGTVNYVGPMGDRGRWW